MTTPKDSRFDLLLPPDTAAKYQQAIAAIPKEMRVLWRYHKVSRGESLADVARQYRTTQSAIAQVNDLKEGELIADNKLIIPVTAGRRAADTSSAAYSRRPTRYKVRKGDTVLSVADDFGVPAEKIRRWNGLRGNQLRAGHTIRIYRPLASPEPGAVTRKGSKSKTSKSLPASSKARVVHHKVRKGETLFSIANRYNTTVAALRRDNHISTLKAGTILVIRTP
jgi:membrane-bound lytic murein transglycosylase D